MKETILVTGGSGLLAVNWAIAMRDQFDVTLGIHDRQIALEGVETRSLSLDSYDLLLRELEQMMPGLVIHAAGLTSVEGCEANPDLASYINIDLAENVARACTHLELPLVHISTDHLFAGDRKYVDEDQATSPQNVYARTKAKAELRVLDAHPKTLVVRTNFYGWGTSYRQSFSDVIINNLREGSTMTLFKDVFYTPILIERLVDAVHELVNQNVTGICNIVGDERISKYQFGLKVANHFKLDSELIEAGSLSDHEDLSRRPMEMSLSNSKVSKLLGRKLGNVDEHLRLLLRQIETGIAKEVQNL